MAEILHQLMDSLSRYLRPVLAPSQVVVWDFIHQQYQWSDSRPLLTTGYHLDDENLTEEAVAILNHQRRVIPQEKTDEL